MDTPVEISFHNMPSSKRIEAETYKRVAKLEKIFGRLISCRVSVEMRSKRHRTGNVYEVHVELFVPRGPVVVTREPHGVKERHTNADVRTSLRDAFRAAELRLSEFKEKQSLRKRVSRQSKLKRQRRALSPAIEP